MFTSSQYISPQLFKNFNQRAEKDLIAGILGHPELEGKYIQRRLASYPFVGLISQGQLITELLMKLWPEEFEDLIKTVKSFESFLGGIRKRGHFVHQFEVFVLGLNIISKIEELTDKNGWAPAFGDRKTIFLRWLMTSTVHDFGYPLEAADDLSKELAKLYKSMGFNDTSAIFADLAKQPKASLASGNKPVSQQIERKNLDDEFDVSDFVIESIKIELGLSSEESEHLKKALEVQANHGYVSAVLLGNNMVSSLIEKHGSWECVKQDEAFKSLGCCLSAIALHALEEKTERSYIRKISFDTNAMTYLLHLIDNIQEWSRGTTENHTKYPNYNLTSYSASGRTINLKYFLQHNNWTPEMVSDTKVFLKKKEMRINLPNLPKTKIGLKILIEYHNNDNDLFDPITVEL